MIRTDLIAHLKALGLIAQVSHGQELDDHLASDMRTVYCGFDPTSDSLQVGNLVPLLALRRFQLHGHRPILLVGGATGMIGDPGGRTTERKLHAEGTVRDYVERIRRQAASFLDFDCGDNSAIVVDNMEWTCELNVIDYLRNIGKHFSVNSMVQKESVRRRLADDGSGISYTEFSYMILQAHDFVVLNQRYGCTLQIGGSDQWGNITGGMDLLRRMHNEQAYALTFPLVTKADGTKFGKSEGESVWVDGTKTSPYAFYQFWMNSSDADVKPFLRYFTLLNDAELALIDREHQQDPGKRSAQKRLSTEITTMVHGEEGLLAATRITEALFRNEITSLSESDMELLSMDGLPCLRVPGSERALLDLLVETGLAVTPLGEVTAGQARKFVQGNAIAVNGQKVTDPELILTSDAALYGRFHVLQRGKKNHALIEWRANSIH